MPSIDRLSTLSLPICPAEAIRYLDVHPYQETAVLITEFKNLRFPLLTNAALCALKLTPKADA